MEFNSAYQTQLKCFLCRDREMIVVVMMIMRVPVMKTIKTKSCVVVHACNLSTQEAKAGRS
jgi:hypothetical protein